MWSDNETAEDLLGFRLHSDLVREIVTDPALLPVTVGLFGDWGSGKSSVMRMLARDLEQVPDVGCIYFNGWQFEGYDDAKAALISSILLELAKHKKLTAKVKKKAASMLKGINWMRAATVGYQTIIAPFLAAQLAALTGNPGMVSLVPIGAANVPPVALPTSTSKTQEVLEEVELSELLADPKNQGLLGARQLRSDFEDLIAESKLKSLVVLIDDLDRCDPERLVQTLEAIKLFLSVPNVAFVIGADYRIVRYAIAKRYDVHLVEAEQGAAVDKIDLVTDYIEKLVQIPYTLPRLSSSEIETYMSLLFCQLHTREHFQQIHTAYLEAHRAHVSAPFGLDQVRQALGGGGCSSDLENALAWSRRIAPALCDALKGNPRQTKRLLNSLLLRRKLAQAAGLTVSDEILVKLMLLEYIRPDLFAQVYQWQAAHEGYAPQLRALEIEDEEADEGLTQQAKDILQKEPAWQVATVHAWRHMPPRLGQVDLRDYFWLTRDRVTGILSGVGLVSPHLRMLLASLLEAEAGTVPEVVRQVAQLSEDDMDALLKELARQLQRQSEPYSLVKVWIDLAATIPAALERLLLALDQLPEASAPWNLPASVGVIVARWPHVRPQAERILQKWQGQRINPRLSNAAREELQAPVKG